MAVHYAPDFGTKPMHACEYGNAVKYHFTASKLAAINDTIEFGIIPAGVTITDVKTINAVTQASCVMDLGYAPVNATLGPTASAAYWMDNADIAAAGVDLSTSLPIHFEHPVRLIALITGATTNTAARIDVILDGIRVGVK